MSFLKFVARSFGSRWIGQKSKSLILNIVFCLLSSVLCFLCSPFAAFAGTATITVGWDPPTDPAAGYEFCYGTSSGKYDYVVDVGSNTSCTISSLEEGTRYYFAAKSYNADGAKSPLSDELAYTVPVSQSTNSADADDDGVLEGANATGGNDPSDSNSYLIISDVSPKDYKVITLNTGDTYYIDRKYEITELPPELEGHVAIQTANNDKKNGQEKFLSFYVNQDVNLYVAYDSRATRYPDWLNSFTNTGMIIKTTDASLSVWKKELAAGAIALPGNYYGNPTGVGSNYFVLIKSYPNNSQPDNSSASPLSELEVSDLNPEDYKVITLNTGDTYYTDRKYEITELPPELEGHVAIQTANNDKKNGQEKFLSFYVNQDVNLYVAYDSRATRYPDWLNSFTNTGMIIKTTDASLSVWKKEFAAGAIALPGSYYGNPTGVGSNYFVLIKSYPNNSQPDNSSAPPLRELEVSDQNPEEYKVITLNTGDTYYTDRKYEITELPPELKGLVAIQTANNDKNNDQKNFLSFYVNQDVTLYVAYDSRATRYPEWLNSYTNTGLTIKTTDVTSLTVWRKEFAAGTITVPGNYYGDPTGVESNYFVIID